MRKNLLIIILPVLLLVVLGCAKIENYGEPLSDREITKISDILKNKDTYSGKTVKVEGKIVNECPTGCWFNITDDTGTLYINLMGANLSIPQRVGSYVVLEGTIAERSGVPMIKGTGVTIK